MELQDLIAQERIHILKSHQKQEAIAELLEHINKSIKFDDPEEILEKLYHREELMSTGIGLGIAIPHIRCCQISIPIVGIGISKQGIRDYETLDEKPVHIMVMIFAGEGQHRQYIKTMSLIVRCLKEDGIIERLEKVIEPSEAYSILMEG